MQTKDKTFDVIIIGSGMGALTCASLLAQLWNKRVLVLERHFKPGGFTHVFKRNAANTYEWDVGLHYIGNMKHGETPRTIFDFITNGAVSWTKMPDPFDVFIYPDLNFKTRSGEQNFTDDLVQLFPDQKRAIFRYVKDIKKTAGWLGRGIMTRNLPGWLSPAGAILAAAGRKKGLMTTGAYLQKNISDEKLRAVLVSQWGDYGLPPGLSAFALHAVIAMHYIEGGYYPRGGAKTIADNIIPLIEQKNGQVLVNHSVTEIIIDKNQAIGVRAMHHKKGDQTEPTEFFANTIISGAGAYITYLDLIPENYDIPFREALQSFPSGSSNVTLYLGLKDNPQKLGYNGENLWIYSDYDHDRLYHDKNEILGGKVGACYVSCPSIKNTQARGHTLEVISFADIEPFKRWADLPWKNRGDEYLQVKNRISDSLIAVLEKQIPGISDLIDYKELSTPLSTHFFTGHRGGSIYGLPGIPQKFKSRWLKIKTPLKNFYLTGSDVAVHGIVGAMMSGVFTTGIVTGMPAGLMKIFKTAMQYSRGLDIGK